MTIERLNENQARVIMTTKDLSERGLTLSELADKTDSGRALFSEIMGDIKSRYGFPTDDFAPVIIEVAPISQSELVIIVSQVKGIGDDVISDIMSAAPMIPLTMDERKYVTKSGCPFADNMGGHRQTTAGESVAVYEFAALDDVISAVRRVETNYAGKTTLYKMTGKYYLVAQANVKTSKKRESDTRFIRVMEEYGRAYGEGELSATLIYERGELIAKQAVQKLRKL